MYIKENKDKNGKVISYRFITSYKDPLLNKTKNATRTWKIPFNLTTKKQIERELNIQKVKFLQDIKNLESGIYSNEIYNNITLKEFALKWLDRILIKNNESQNHYSHSKKILHFILDFFKDTKLCNINKVMIDAFYNHINTLTYTQKRYIIKKPFYELKPKNMTHYDFFHNLNISEQTYKKTRTIGAGINEQTYHNIYNYIKDKINEYIEIKTITKSYALATKNNIRLILVAIFSYAKQLGIIEHNIADSTFFKSPISGTSKEKKALNYNEFLDFANQIKRLNNIKHKTILTLLYTLGLRRCEAVGLKWSDIDFNNKTIFIQRDVIHTKESRTIIRSTKNISSTRLLPMSDELVSTLLEFRNYWVEENYTMEDPSEFLFRQKNGYVMFPDTVNTILKNFIIRNNLTKISPHELRHTFITIMVTVYKIPISIVGNFVGHNQIATTFNTYTHINDMAKLQITDSLNKSL